MSIRFDLDIGPKIEFVSPPDAITEEGKVKLLRCAFPDCNPDCGYNFIFYFTMPDCTTAAAQSFSQTVAPPTTGNTVPELYGAAFYRQKHDPNVPRCYVQQVLVLLSHLPYYNVHEIILRVVAPRFCQCCPLSPDTGKVPVSSSLIPVPEAYFEFDQSYSAEHYTQEGVLSDAMAELAQWPSPHPQTRYTVTLLQQALVFITPAHSQRQSSRATRSSCASVRSAMSVDKRVEFMEVARGSPRHRASALGSDFLPLFRLLGEQLHHLTHVWELLIRHEPLFILSNTPCMASAAAFSIASLVLPIEFSGTLRSYFTVQNEDFPRLSRMGKVLSFPTNEGLIVAGTNPFLLRSFSGWPSLMVVMDGNTSIMVNGSIASPPPSAMAGAIPPLPQASPLRSQRSGACTAVSLASSLLRATLPGGPIAKTSPRPPLNGAHARTASGQEPLSVAMCSSNSTTSLGSGSTSAHQHNSLGAPVTVVPSSFSSFNGNGDVFADVASRKPIVSSASSNTVDLPATYNVESPTYISPFASSTSRDSARRVEAAQQAQRSEDGSPAGEHASTCALGESPAQPSSGVSSHAERFSHGREYARLGSSDATLAAAAHLAPAPITMPSPVDFSVTLFTTDHYKTAVESVRAAEHERRGSANHDDSRKSLQQRLHNYFDSSVHFLLNHEEQTQMLLKRLQMVSLLDEDAQRASVSLSLSHWHGNPRTVSSPTTSSKGLLFASPTPPLSSANTNSASGHCADPAAATNGITSCSHFSVADDMVRKFFTSLTSEFLTPVTAWFQRVTAPYTAFHLCDRAFCDTLLTPSSFLDDFAQRHRETAPSMWTQRHSYKTYKVVYERFAYGCLFKAYVLQLVDGSLRQQMEDFQVEDWVTRVPSDAERIDLLINLFNTVQRELNETLDPDVLFVTSATSVLASMAVVLQQPHREQFMLKIGELKL
ncbi:conserved hypothetical protein [Leishmania major strain Friedlin]|uniref:UDENN domain-containing protein n=1 Tax=Leishmania major TaxID=5664 RepID=Q4Q1L3_LEIMA|nr:conserved hypothetical protein [Leishmania major strain Friedlin]CAG9583736.1 hypothetical_protein_-_conserved [Leishmania major strain Friedlin]CAJ09166.1 conserved hypothetical protein [Leishmania major strain Friedlin]|eukprot:XP_001686785.1 conserved hypothetical protein [Leishmania major strain Friedlin]